MSSMKMTSGQKEKSVFARRLMTARVAAGYRSAYQFAKENGYRYDTYRQWEAGNSRPEYDTLKALCKTLGITPNYLLWDDDDTVLTTVKAASIS
jgi:transcriptional regulator with XRE-family HTH domain